MNQDEQALKNLRDELRAKVHRTDFGSHMKSIRLAAGYPSVTAVCKALSGGDKVQESRWMSSLSAWERGQTRPGGSSGDRLTILANLYHVDPDSLDPDAFPKAEKMTKPKLPVTKAVKVEAEARPVENGLFLKGVQVEPVAGGRMLIRFEAVVSAKDSQGFVAQLLQVAANAAVGK